MQQDVRLKLFFFPHLPQIILSFILISFSTSAMALCVLMSDFEKDDNAFTSIMNMDGLYDDGPNGKRISPVYHNGLEIPVPSKAEAAGDPCYVFKTYDGLEHFINHRDEYPEYGIDGDFGWPLPKVAPDEPLFINHLSHGDRTGEVAAGDILEFAKRVGENHRIALTSLSCFSSDLLAKMLLDQERGKYQKYIENFCLMTPSTFTNFNYGPSSPEDDKSLIGFLKRMDETQKGKSMAQFFRENNYYNDKFLSRGKQPLFLCSAANWGQMGFVDYINWGEDIFNFTKHYNPAEPPVWDFLFYYRAEQRIKAAIPLLNNINKMFEMNTCLATKDHSFAQIASVAYLNTAIQTVCQDVDRTELREAQACIPRYHLGHQDFLYKTSKSSNGSTASNEGQSTTDNNESNQPWDWENDCLKNQRLNALMSRIDEFKSFSESNLPSSFIQEAANIQSGCINTACSKVINKYYYEMYSQYLLPISTKKFNEEKQKYINKINEDQTVIAGNYVKEYPAMLAQQLKKKGIDGWDESKISEQLNNYYKSNGQVADGDTNTAAQNIDCGQWFDNYFPTENCELKNTELQKQCSALYETMLTSSPQEWPKLPTYSEENAERADLILQVLLRAYDINENNGLWYTGHSASSYDYSRDYGPGYYAPSALDQYRVMESDSAYATTNDIFATFHNIMGVAMIQKPDAENYPLDAKRRAACENFKLGGSAAQKKK